MTINIIFDISYLITFSEIDNYLYFTYTADKCMSKQKVRELFD